MKHFITIVFIFLLVSACQPTPEQVQKAIEKTQVAAAEITAKAATNTPPPLPTKTKIPTRTIGPTNTIAPTFAPNPTRTRTPKATETAAKSVEEIRIELESVFTKLLESSSDVSQVNMVRVSEGLIEIEFKTIWASRDRQPTITFDFLQLIAVLFQKDTRQDIVNAYGGDSVIVKVTTYSESGDYRFRSETNRETMIKIAEKHITFDGWVSEANAGFK